MSEFASAIDSIEPSFRRLVEMNPFRLEQVPSPVPAGRPGVYLLSESDRPLYVGRARDVRDRLSNHRSSAVTQATLAVKMARSDLQDLLRRGEGANLRPGGPLGRGDR